MKTKLPTILCLALCIAGVILAVLTHGGAVGSGATPSGKVFFSLSVILAVAGLAGSIASLRPRRQKTDVRSLAMASIFAALCYVGCTVLRIPFPGSSSFFHFGNTFCVLGALFLGGFWGGMAGSVGMTLSDLLTGYVDTAPRTFILKLCIGLITGFVAHRVFHIREKGSWHRISLAAALSSTAGMAFNVIADPLLGYFYKMYVMGVEQDIAATLAKIKTIPTAVNAIVAIIAATIFYLALRPALTRAQLMPRVE